MSKIVPRLGPLHIAASPTESPEGMSPPVSQGPIIVTSKEWVLPPRPKPGRKPSAEAPASKRKAQNRAAQRAFRERRATRVQELEEQLLEVAKETEQRELGFINSINKLKLENQFLIKNIEKLRQEVYMMRRSSGALLSPVQKSMHPNGGVSTTTYSPAGSVGSPGGGRVQQISPGPTGNSPPAFETAVADLVQASTEVVDDDCGVCIKDDCLCEEVGLKQKRPLPIEEAVLHFKPMAAVSLKRRKQADSNEIEIDFTRKFSTKKPLPDLSKLKKKLRNNNEFMESKRKADVEFNETSPVENCGFCTDDTPCVCREAAKEAAEINNKLNKPEIKTTSLPPILNSNFRKVSLPVLHPGPSVEINNIANLSPGAVPTVVSRSQGQTTTASSSSTPTVGTPSLGDLADAAESTAPISSTTDSGCTGNPGTCSQCQMDPMSTLFCTTVASIRPKESQIEQQQQQQQQLEEQFEKQKKKEEETGIFIPCSDAYKTLSRHKQFKSVDFSTLVGKLTTRGMQVEVQSVANVLRELDRRLYN